MKFVRTELELDVYGTKYNLRFPTMDEFSHFASEADKEGANEVELTYRLLAKLGLPEDVTRGMEPRHVTQVVESLAPKK